MSQAYRDKVRVICHSLRMASLAGVDPTKVIDLSSRIRALPSPERIASMSHGDLAEVSARVERIIFDMGNARNSRTFDYAIRHRIEKGIPPRLAPVLASGGTWLDRAAAAEDGKDYSRTLHPDWVVSKTSQKIGPSRIFRLSFGDSPVLDFTLSRDNHGKYDGGIEEVRWHHGAPWPRTARTPMTCELFSRASDLVGHMRGFQDASPEEFHAVMRDGAPMPGEE